MNLPPAGAASPRPVRAYFWALLLLTCALAFRTAYVSPTQAQLAQMHQQEQALRRQVRLDLVNQRNVRVLTLAIRAEEASPLREAVPSGPGQHAFIAYLDRLQAASGARVTLLSFQPPVFDAKDNVDVYSVTLSAIGSSESLLSLLNGIDQGPRLNHVKALSLSGSGQQIGHAGLSPGEEVDAILDMHGRVARLNVLSARAHSLAGLLPGAAAAPAGGGPIPGGSTVAGTVTAVNGTQSLQVVATGGRTVTLALAPSLVVTEAGRPAALTALAPGARISCTLNARHQVTAIEVTGPAPPQPGSTVAGVVTQVGAGEVTLRTTQGQTVTLPLAPAVVITATTGQFVLTLSFDLFAGPMVSAATVAAGTGSPAASAAAVAGTASAAAVAGKTGMAR